MHDFRLRDLLGDAGQVRLPHVGRDGANLLALLGRQRFPERIGRFLGAIRSHVQHASRIQVGHDRDVAVALAKTLFIQADIMHLVDAPPSQPTLDSSLHDSMYSLPVEREQLGGPLDVGCGPQHFHREGLE